MRARATAFDAAEVFAAVRTRLLARPHTAHSGRRVPTSWQAVRDARRDTNVFVRQFRGAWVDNDGPGLGGEGLPTSREAAKPLGDVGPLFGPPVPMDWFDDG